LSVTLFEKTPILQALSGIHCENQVDPNDKQPNLFN